MKETLLKLLDMNHDERQQYMNEKGDILIENMLKNIGYPEDELRDKLNYRLFIEMLADNLFTTVQMNQLTKKLKGADFLYASIGERDTDQVFIRSFSALWLCGLLNVDSQIRFLSDEEAKEILEATTHYLSQENDVRGFVHDKGWAHAIAHGADLATAIVAHPLFEMRFAPTLLQGIKNSLWKGTVYIDDEDERLVTIIEKLMIKDFPEEILIEWVEQVFDKLQYYLMEVGYTPQYFAARTNTLHFMKTLYFTLKFSQKMPELKGVVSLFIGKWMKQ